MIILGNTEITKAYLGNTEIDKIYLGEELVFSSGPAYDAQVEYLEATGTQYIDTNLIMGDDNYTIEAKFNISSGSASSYSALFTNRQSSRNTYGFAINGSRTYVNPCNNPNSAISITYTRGIDYTLSLKKGEMILNGTTYTNTSYVTDYSASSLWIFRQRYNNSGISAKLYSLSILHNENVIMDFIPVRVNQVGCLYDRITNTLFKNVGTGNFIYGNDVTT